MNVTIKPENWFWCDLCECVSYNYECECHGSWCNAGGCDKCHELRMMLERLHDLNMFPSKEFALENNLRRFGSKEIPENALLRKIFGSS
jgi:hypothetical protein